MGREGRVWRIGNGIRHINDVTVTYVEPGSYKIADHLITDPV